jgi:hypothetical protein
MELNLLANCRLETVHKTVQLLSIGQIWNFKAQGGELMKVPLY